MPRRRLILSRHSCNSRGSVRPYCHFRFALCNGTNRAVPRNIITPELGEAIKVAHAAGIPLREFARNRKLNENTVLSYAKRQGLTQEIQTAKGDARLAVQSDALTNVQSVATTMVQRGQRYVGRMMDISEKVVPHLESLSPAEFIEGIHEIKKFDDMTRRHAGLNDNAGLGGSLSIEVLTNQAAVRVTTQGSGNSAEVSLAN